jgi:hypothetical protein
LGRFWLDSCGNWGIAIKDAHNVIPKELYPDIPDVLSERQFSAFMLLRSGADRLPKAIKALEECFPDISLKDHQKSLDMLKEAIGSMKVSWGHAGSSAIGSPDIPCAHCGKTWRLEDCHDCERYSDDLVFPLAEFVGKTFGTFEASLKERGDAVYFVQPELKIRHDRFIDLSPDPRYKTLLKNERGWVGRNGEINDSYVIQEGDETLLVRRRFYHPSCHAAVLADSIRKSFSDMFVSAGFEPNSFAMRETANEYGSARYAGPWYDVQTLGGVVTIGWRHRVMQIDWSKTGNDLSRLFKDVTNTKGPFFLHADSTEQAVDYLGRIRTALSNMP